MSKYRNEENLEIFVCQAEKLNSTSFSLVGCSKCFTSHPPVTILFHAFHLIRSGEVTCNILFDTIVVCQDLLCNTNQLTKG